MFFLWKSHIRALLTEWGGTTAGDHALCVATARRLLDLRVRPTFLLRAPFHNVLRTAALKPRCVDFPLPETIFSDASSDRILSLFESRLPEQFKTLQALLQETDVVMTAPGARMSDGYAVERNLVVSLAAFARNIPVINLHQSVGPCTSPARRQLIREWMKQSRLTVIRDECSAAFVRELGIPADRWTEARDMIFAERYPAPQGPPEYDVGINARFGWNGHANPNVTRDFLLRYRAKHPHRKVLIYTTTNVMSEATTSLLSTAGYPIERYPVAYPNFLRAIGRCAVHASDSFHGIVFCAMARVPTVALQPDWQAWKIQGTTAPGANSLQPLEGFVNEEAAEAVAREIELASAQREERTQVLSRIAEYGREMAEVGWQRIAAVLREIQ